MPTLDDFINNNKFSSVSDLTNKLSNANITLNEISQKFISDSQAFKTEISNFANNNKFGPDNTFSWNLPSGLSKVDLKAYFNWTKLNLEELKNNPYKIGILAGFSLYFCLTNPSWREGQIWNPLSPILSGTPLIGQFLPAHLDTIGSLGHEQLAKDRDDIKKTYESYSAMGSNIVHGPFDANIRINSDFPFIHFGQDFSNTIKKDMNIGISLSDMVERGNENSIDYPYPKYSPVTQDVQIKPDAEFYNKLYQKPNIFNLFTKDMEKTLSSKGELTKKSWVNDMDSSWINPDPFCNEIINTKDVPILKNSLYVPFFITDLRTQKTAVLKPYLRRITSDVNPNYNISEYFNRTDPIANLKNTKRNLSVDFMMMAETPEGLTRIRNQQSFIENLTYPLFDSNTFQAVASPVCRIRIGDLINVNPDELNTFITKTNSTINTDILELGVPGIITSINYDLDTKYCWQIEDDIKTLQVFGMTLTFMIFSDYLRGQLTSLKRNELEVSKPPPEPKLKPGKNGQY